MERWKIVGVKRQEGGADRSADVDYCFRFELDPVDQSGEGRLVYVEAARGPRRRELTEELARAEVTRWLKEADPILRITMSREGYFQPAPPEVTS